MKAKRERKVHASGLDGFSACGMVYCFAAVPYMTFNWYDVTCKRCLSTWRGRYMVPANKQGSEP